MDKKLLFSVTIKDCEVSAFKGSGSGGQARNKISSGIRIHHPPSNAVGRASDSREQHRNKRTAFLRMLETKEFKAWHKVMCCRLMGQKSVEELVEETMHPKNILTEIKDEAGVWIKEV